MSADYEFISAPEPRNNQNIRNVKLNSIDNSLKDVNIEYCFFFKNQTKSLDFMPAVLMLDSLKSVLNYFPELTGRVEWPPETDEPTIQICNLGVKFCAIQTSLKDDQLFESHEKMNQIYWNTSKDLRNVISDVHNCDLTENQSIPLSIMMIRTSDRSVLLSITAMHSVMDGFAFVNLFMANWGRVARGSEMLMVEKRVLERGQIDGSRYSAELNQSNVSKLPKPKRTSFTEAVQSNPIRFIIGKNQIRKLISQLKKSVDDVDFVNETTALFALIWTINTQINAQSSSPATLYFPIDLRTQLKLPRSYMGNAVVSVTVTGLEKSNAEQDMLITACDAIATAIKSRSQSDLQALVHDLHNDSQWFDQEPQSLMISPITHLSWNEIDFGHGRFDWVANVEEKMPLGLALIFPAPDSSPPGGVLVQMALSDQAKANLMDSKPFQKFAKLSR